MSESEDEVSLTDDISPESVEESEDEPLDDEPPTDITEEIEDFEDVTPKKRKVLGAVPTKVRETLGRMREKISLTDRQLNTMSRWTEYGMIAVIVAAILTIIGFGFNVAIAGWAVPFVFYAQVFLGCLVVSFGLFLLLIVLEGGADYLSQRVR